MGIEAQFIVASLVAGLFTILAPCVIPVLPVIIGTSAKEEKNRLKPVVITASLMVSVVIFTLLLRGSAALITIPPKFWTTFAGVILIIFGLFTVFPELWDKVSIKLGLSNSSNRFLAKASKKGGLYGDMLVGFALGPVFTSCSPTFGLIVGIVLSGDLAAGFVYLLVYALGLGIMLLAIAFAGQALIKRLGWATDPHGVFRKVIGIIFILIGLMIITGFDKTIESWVLDSGSYDWIINIEEKFN